MGDNADKSGLRKIGDFGGWHTKPCLHPEHLPPKHLVYDPGEYEYTCPACGNKIRFIVPMTGCCSHQPVVVNSRVGG